MPFGEQLADKYLSDAKEVEAAAKAGIRHLHQCYQALSSDSAFGADVLQSEAIAFAWQYTALSKFHDGVLWRLKPKLHLLFWNLLQSMGDLLCVGHIETKTLEAQCRKLLADEEALSLRSRSVLMSWTDLESSNRCLASCSDDKRKKQGIVDCMLLALWIGIPPPQFL